MHHFTKSTNSITLALLPNGYSTRPPPSMGTVLVFASGYLTIFSNKSPFELGKWPQRFQLLIVLTRWDAVSEIDNCQRRGKKCMICSHQWLTLSTHIQCSNPPTHTRSNTTISTETVTCLPNTDCQMQAFVLSHQVPPPPQVVINQNANASVNWQQ